MQKRETVEWTKCNAAISVEPPYLVRIAGQATAGSSHIFGAILRLRFFASRQLATVGPARLAERRETGFWFL